MVFKTLHLFRKNFSRLNSVVKSYICVIIPDVVRAPRTFTCGCIANTSLRPQMSALHSGHDPELRTSRHPVSHTPYRAPPSGPCQPTEPVLPPTWARLAGSYCACHLALYNDGPCIRFWAAGSITDTADCKVSAFVAIAQVRRIIPTALHRSSRMRETKEVLLAEVCWT